MHTLRFDDTSLMFVRTAINELPEKVRQLLQGSIEAQLRAEAQAQKMAEAAKTAAEGDASKELN